MERNRYFKATLGVSAEIVIAASLDTSGAAADGVKPAAATSTLTVAAAPAVGDRISFTILGQNYVYTVAAGDTTAATLVASIVTYLNSFNAPWTASVTGTTSAVFTFTPNQTGTALNNGTNAIAAGTPNVSTFSAPVATAQFGSGGTNGNAAGFQPTFQAFTASAPAGTLGLYWDDNSGQVSGANANAAVQPGALGTYANIGRSYFYGWKDAAGNTLRTSAIPVAGRLVKTSRYAAAVLPQFTITLGGTYTLGQEVWIKISDISAVQTPNPNWEYSVISSGVAATDATNLAAAINAENLDKQFTASPSTNVVTITAINSNRVYKVTSYLAVQGLVPNGTPINTDASAIVVANTVATGFENGTVADVKELEKYLKIRNGVMVYVSPNGGQMILPDEFNVFNSNIVIGGQYGYITVKAIKTELHQSNLNEQNAIGYFFITVPDTLVLALANY
jgi:hypothetical protein